MLIGYMRGELMGGSPRRLYPALIQGTWSARGRRNFRVQFPGVLHARVSFAPDLKPGAFSRALFLSAGEGQVASPTLCVGPWVRPALMSV